MIYRAVHSPDIVGMMEQIKGTNVHREADAHDADHATGPANLNVFASEYQDTANIAVSKAGDEENYTAWVIVERRRLLMRSDAAASPAGALENLLEATADLVAQTLAAETKAFEEGPGVVAKDVQTADRTADQRVEDENSGVVAKSTLR